MASLSHPRPDAMPSASGIQLISTRTLPDRIRSVFPYPFFNAIQSKCFNTIYNTSNNFVLSAPTASGKTVILELAICRFVTASSSSSNGFKAVYQAPTKALCSERCRDWRQKFGHLNLKCEELTGDTEQSEIKAIQGADIIVTTPEKWDSTTRKWKDHRKLMDLVKLFLIDEVHILKEDRGATLEAVVSRMRTVGHDVRFVALSATVPNSEDIATWLGLNSQEMHLPAIREVFGEDFRPVRLEKHIIGLQGSGNNEWMFDKICSSKLPEVVVKHSKGKPIMVFCITRKVAQSTALDLAKWWHESRTTDRCWDIPRKPSATSDADLSYCMKAGVAFHHAGISVHERRIVEEGYISGDISVICCTATLAVGVNLPCHLVIIKNTVYYRTETATCVEYSDLDMMQMLGRAGRPQYDKSAVAVIMTRQEKAQRYENMVQGKELLESRLHLNLIEHLNSEIGLGTIFDLRSACRWLQSTFWFVRVKQNPSYYKIAGNRADEDPTERVKHICKEDLASLQQYDLIQGTSGIRATELGDAMSRYSVTFATMKLFLGLPKGAKTSEVLSAVAQAHEFSSLRFKAGEKAMYKEFNSSNMARFPIKVNLDCPAHKVSLIVQSALAGVDPAADKRFQHLGSQYSQDRRTIMQQARRFLKCITDCEIHLQDAVAARTSMALARSLAAEAWDDAPCQLAQIEQIGPVAVRRLAGASIRTVEDLESCEPRKIEMILSRNPPFGSVILKNLQHFPRLRVSMNTVGQPMISDKEGVTIKVKAELGFLNNHTPAHFHRQPVQVCFLAEGSEGRLLHFCRTSASRLASNPIISFTVTILRSTDKITGYISCDDIAGTMIYATLEPRIPIMMFSVSRNAEMIDRHPTGSVKKSTRMLDDDRRAIEPENFNDEIADDDLIDTLKDNDFANIDDISSDGVVPLPARPLLAGKGKVRQTHKVEPVDSPVSKEKMKQKPTKMFSKASPGWQPERLKNGNWKCNHQCKDKQRCKHTCCRNGTESKPKPPKSKKAEEMEESTIMQAFKQRKLLCASKQENSKDSIITRSSARQATEPARSSSTLYEGDDDVFDEIDQGALLPASQSVNRGANKCLPGEKYYSLFKNDTSSPQKHRVRDHGIEEIDLSSDVPEIVTGKSKTRQPTISKRPLSPAMTDPRSKRLATLNDIESSMAAATSSHGAQASQSLRSSVYAVQPWSKEAEDLFGNEKFEGHGTKQGLIHHDLALDVPINTQECPRNSAGKGEDDFQADLGSDDLRSLLCEDPKFDGPVRLQDSDAVPTVHGVNDATSSANAANAGPPNAPDVAARDEIDAFIMREFGDYVNFV